MEFTQPVVKDADCQGWHCTTDTTMYTAQRSMLLDICVSFQLTAMVPVRLACTQLAWLAVTEVQSTSFALVLHAQHIVQILSIFSSSDGYQLQFSIPRAYFVYTVWHCTGQGKNSIKVLPQCFVYGRVSWQDN